MYDKQSIEEWILNTLKNEFNVKAATAAGNYFTAGLDSISFIDFLMETEGEFGISFSNDEFQNREFATPQGLANIICGKLNV